MFEEEAFIRAIVDHPRDDLPRLVYADWLDERDDHRATYLRAELTWAEERRGVAWSLPSAEELDRGMAPALQKLASGLDALWVARVSRPPVGVCYEHIEFRDIGPRISDSDLDGFERVIGYPLPADYRGYLLNTNGGIPTSGSYVWTESDATDRAYWPVECLYSLAPADAAEPPLSCGLTGAHVTWTMYFQLREYVTIGMDQADCVILLRLTGPLAGQVVGVNTIFLNLDPIARTLPILLDSLRRDHPYELGEDHNSGKDSKP